MLLRQGEVPLYRDPTAAVEARVADLLARMTVDEKIAQLHAAWLKLSSDGNHEARTVDFAHGDAGIMVETILQHGLGQITRPLGTRWLSESIGQYSAFHCLPVTS